MTAIVSFTAPVAEEALRRGTAALLHRGPDGATHWLSDDGRAGLGHTLLGIVDPLGGRQPIESEDGRFHIVVNGEFYDFDRIRSELQARGHAFRSGSDSEIALHLYEERGARCLEELRGEFAFVIWDRREQTLFAARDRFGIKPLVFAEQNGAVLLASEAKALFAAGVTPAWDHESVFQAIHGCHDLHRTLFRGVRHVPPGHTLTVSRRGLRIAKYWDVQYPLARNLPAVVDERACTEEVRELLIESVRLRMRADVPVGYLLSGGLDSSAMLGIAAASSDQAVHAFTIAFSSDEFDESKQAADTARHVGADLTVLRVSDADLASAFVESVRHTEGMQYNAHASARLLLSRTIQEEGYRAVMGGEGADEVFAGYAFVRNAAIAQSRGALATTMRLPWALLRPLRGDARALAAMSPLLGRGASVVDVPDWLVSRGVEWLGTLRGVLAPDFLQEFRGRDPYWSFLRTLDLRKVLGREPARQLLYVWLRSIFVGYHLGADRLDMAHGVEVRLPYLDHRLFERVSQIPVSSLMANGQPKHLLRQAARPYLTESVYHGEKKPFFAPPTATQPSSPLHELIQALFRSDAMGALPFVDQRAAISLLDRLPTLSPTARATLDPVMMLLASLVVLQQSYGL